MIFSGNTNNGSLDGTLYLNANNSSTNSNVNIDTGNLLTIDSKSFPYLLVKRKQYTSLCFGRVTEESEVARQ